MSARSVLAAALAVALCGCGASPDRFTFVPLGAAVESDAELLRDMMPEGARITGWQGQGPARRLVGEGARPDGLLIPAQASLHAVPSQAALADLSVPGLVRMTHPQSGEVVFGAPGSCEPATRALAAITPPAGQRLSRAVWHDDTGAMFCGPMLIEDAPVLAARDVRRARTDDSMVTVDISLLASDAPAGRDRPVVVVVDGVVVIAGLRLSRVDRETLALTVASRRRSMLEWLWETEGLLNRVALSSRWHLLAEAS